MAKKSKPMQVEAQPAEGAAPPGHLSAEMRAWWLELCAQYVFQSQHMKLLRHACEAWDRAESARKETSFHGLTVATEFGSKAHPCIAIERESRALFLRCLDQLGLDDVPPPGAVAKPHRRSRG